jgi:hypothetical protein
LFGCLVFTSGGASGLTTLRVDPELVGQENGAKKNSVDERIRFGGWPIDLKKRDFLKLCVP